MRRRHHLIRSVASSAIMLVLVLATLGLPASPAWAEPSITVSGHVYLGSADRPAAANEIEMRPQQWTGEKWGPDGPSVSLATDGAWSVQLPANPMYRMRIVYVGTDTFAKESYSDWVGNNRTEIDTIVAHRYTVSGTVRLADGTTAPPGSARVDLDTMGSRVASVTVGEDGKWEANNLAGNRAYYVSVTWIAPTGSWFRGFWTGNGCFPECPLTVFTNVQGVDVTLQQAAAFSGTTRIGGVVGAVSVEVYKVDPATGDATYLTRAASDAAGRYRFTDLAAGRYVVSFKAPNGDYSDQLWRSGNPLADPVPLDLQLGDNPGIDADLPRTARISGQVTGVPTADLDEGNVSVEIQLRGADGTFEVADVADIADDGSFEIANLYPDAYRFVISYDGPLGHTDSTSQTYTLGPGSSARWNSALRLPSVPRDRGNFISLLYSDFLDREPSTSDVANWGDAIARGFPRGSVSSGFVNSDEYRLIRIDSAYRYILGRDAEPGGRASWLNGMKVGTLQTDDIERSLYGSEEFYNQQGGTAQAYVQALYDRILSRAATRNEYPGWAASLTSGSITRRALVDVFWISQETGQTRARAMFQTYLRRDPDPSETLSFGSYILRFGDSAVRAMITGSDEYYALAQVAFTNPTGRTGAVVRS